jgi:hypothetical protein
MLLVVGSTTIFRLLCVRTCPHTRRISSARRSTTRSRGVDVAVERSVVKRRANARGHAGNIFRLRSGRCRSYSATRHEERRDLPSHHDGASCVTRA